MAGVKVLVSAENGELPYDLQPHEIPTYLANLRKYELDQYYDDIKDFTFKTKFLKLSLEQVSAWRKYNRGAALTPEEEIHFSTLKDAIGETLKLFPDRCFVRLSTRSPKDAVDKLQKVVPNLCAQLKSCAKEKNVNVEDLKPNDKLICLRKAFFQTMAVKTTEDVLELMKMSARVISDIKIAIDHVDKSPWNLKLIFRSFEDFPLEGELRGFVHNGKLNALTQYYTDCYFPYLVQNQKEIENRVKNFFEVVKEHIKLDSYIIDFIVTKDKVMIVELNPFSEETGSGLFNWNNDITIIEDGPFRFRVQPGVSDQKSFGHLLQWKTLLSKAVEECQDEAWRNKIILVSAALVGFVSVGALYYLNHSKN